MVVSVAVNYTITQQKVSYLEEKQAQTMDSIKDLRTDFEVGNPSAVLDGEIDGFIEAGIKWRKSTD